jgi:hypothetical protein
MGMKKANEQQPYVIVRTYSAGVFAANLVSREGKEAKLANARRLWYWDGAASLSQLAVEGVSKPKTCKFSMPVPTQEVTEVIEVLYATAAAEANIKAVPEWRV